MENTFIPISVFVMLVPSSYLIADGSTVDMKQVILSNIIDKYANTYDHKILFSAENTNIQMVECEIKQTDINLGGIGYMNNGTLSLDKVLVQDIKFYNNPKKMRQLQNVQVEENESQNIISLFYIVKSKIKIIKSKVDQVQCEKNCTGGYLYTESSELNIASSNFTKIQSNDGGVIYISNPYNQQIIQDSIFKDNNSQNNGGSLLITSSKQNKVEATINGNQYYNNNAQNGKGGAIYISINDPLSSSSINITNNIIQNNAAKIGGGIKYDGIIPNITGNSILENKASSFGQNVFSYPSKLYLENINDILQQNPNIQIQDNLMIIQKHRSGGRLPYLNFTLRNNNSDILKLEQNYIEDELITISVDKQDPINEQYYYIRGEIRKKYDQNESFFELKDLDLIGNSSTTIKLFVQSNLIRVENNETNTILNSYSFVISVQIDDCQIGQIPKVYNKFQECSICANGTYSFDKQDCQKCPQGADCLGGDQIIVQQYFWRKSQYDDLILYCNNLQENCVGGKFGNDICYEGHIGPLCEECDIYGDYWGESYAKQGKYSCAKCSEISYNSYIVIILTFWTLISMIISIKGNTKAQKQKYGRRSSIVQETPHQLEEEEDQTGVYLKIFTNYFQIISSISTFNLQVPSGLMIFSQSIGQPISQTLNSLDCALKDINSSIPIIYFRLLFSITMPFVYLTIFIIGLVAYSLIKKQKKFLTYQIYTALIFLQIYLQPDLVAQMIASISCRQIGNSYYILSNISFECFTNEFYNWGLGLALPALLLETIIFPFILYNLLRKNKEKLERLEVKLKYGFLYKEYTSKCFYWEFLKMSQKISIILALNFYSYDVKTKGILVFIVITIYSILSLVFKPYKQEKINKLDSYSTNVCSISVLMGVFLYDNQIEYFIYIAFGIIIIFNLWFILLMVKEIIQGYIQKLTKKIQQILENFGNKFKFAEKYLEKKKETKIKLPKFKNETLKNKIQQQLFTLKDLSIQQKESLVLEFQIQSLQKKLKENSQYLDSIVDQNAQINRQQRKSSDFTINSPQQNLIDHHIESATTNQQSSFQLISLDHNSFKSNPLLYQIKESVTLFGEVITEAKQEEENDENLKQTQDDENNSQ